jgi:diguanylate cyclase (GGDEF)-like protein
VRRLTDERLADRRLPAAPDSRDRRDRLTRISDLRRTLRTGSLLVAVILLVTGFILAARFPPRAVPLFVLWTSGAAITFGLYVAAGRASRRFVVPLTIVFTVIPAATLMYTATEPAALLSMASGFTMLPVAVPLFLAWTPRLRTAWLVGYAVVFGGLTIVTGFGHLDATQRIDLATNVVIGSFIGWVGGFLLERLRSRTLEQQIELRRLNHELRIRSTTDALTGLANRRQLDTDLRSLSGARPMTGSACAFIMLDLDRFKRLNDERGHAEGDAALREVADALVGVLRGRDTIYRYGGEEFLVIMPEATVASATAAAERIRSAIAELGRRLAGEHGGTDLTVSCGVALSSVGRGHWEPVLAAADSALYEAKALGRDRVVVIPTPVGDDVPRQPRDRRRSS